MVRLIDADKFIDHLYEDEKAYFDKGDISTLIDEEEEVWIPHWHDLRKNPDDLLEERPCKLNDCDKITLALKERGISIETIENYIKFEDECVKKGFSFKSLIEAREKQTAKRPYFESDGYYDGKLVYDTWICPNCGESYEAEYDECEYCPKCGQRIDWTE